MQEVSKFLGIIISFNYNLPSTCAPHFYVSYEEEYEGVFLINNLKMCEGNLPKRVKNLVLEWADEHRGELTINWNLAKDKEPLHKIALLV